MIVQLITAATALSNGTTTSNTVLLLHVLKLSVITVDVGPDIVNVVVSTDVVVIVVGVVTEVSGLDSVVAIDCGFDVAVVSLVIGSVKRAIYNTLNCTCFNYSPYTTLTSGTVSAPVVSSSNTLIGATSISGEFTTLW